MPAIDLLVLFEFFAWCHNYQPWLSGLRGVKSRNCEDCIGIWVQTVNQVSLTVCSYVFNLLGDERQDTHLEQTMYCLFLPDLNDSSGENVT